MVDALSFLIDAGRIKLYCLDSLDHLSWSNKAVDHETRARLMHERPDQRFPGWHAALDALIAAEPPAGRALAAPEDMSDRAAGDRA